MGAKRALRAKAAPNVFEAFRELVLAQDVEHLAGLTGMNPGTLYNKANADEDARHQPTLRDAVRLTAATGDMRVVEAFAETFGRATFDCGSMGGTSDEALLELVTNLAAENGDFHRALSTGLREQRFSAEALRGIRAEAYDMVSALMTLVTRLQDYVDDGAA